MYLAQEGLDRAGTPGGKFCDETTVRRRSAGRLRRGGPRRVVVPADNGGNHCAERDGSGRGAAGAAGALPHRGVHDVRGEQPGCGEEADDH